VLNVPYTVAFALKVEQLCGTAPEPNRHTMEMYPIWQYSLASRFEYI
jgi:hypothetical protein